MLSALAFIQMAGWQVNELTLRFGPLHQADIALAACGLGIGLVIAPLAATVLNLTRTAAHGLYNHALSTYGVEDRFDHRAAEGFIHLLGLQLQEFSRQHGGISE